MYPSKVLAAFKFSKANREVTDVQETEAPVNKGGLQMEMPISAVPPPKREQNNFTPHIAHEHPVFQRVGCEETCQSA